MAHVVVAGSAFSVKGGVSAVARVCEREGLFQRWGVRYLATHCDGSAWMKARQAGSALLRLLGMLARSEVALLHVHLNSDASFWRKSLLILPTLLCRVPCVLQIHCGRFADFHAHAPAPARGFMRWLFRRSAGVVALSEQARQSLQCIAPDVPIDVVPNPVSIPKRQATLQQGPPTVLFMGMITQPKGALDLLQAWPGVLRSIPQARLVLAGSGAIDVAHAAARNGGFEHSLLTPGWVDEETREKLLEEAWVLALPSHWEAMPMSVLEAQAAGVPVVASRVGGIPSIVEEGGSGLLIAPGDTDALTQALIDLLRDDERRRAMGNRARLRTSRLFSPAAVLPGIERVS